MPPRCGRLEPMSRSAPPPPPRSDIGVQVGLVVAAAQVPGTFAPGLTPRSDVDQGLTTALSTGLHYLLTLGTQDALQAAAAELARTPVAGRWSDPATRARALTLAADLAAVAAGAGAPTGPPHPSGRGDGARGCSGRPDGARRSTGVAALCWRPPAPGIRAWTTGSVPGGGSRPPGRGAGRARRSRSSWTAADGCAPDDGDAGPAAAAPGALAARGRGSGGHPRGRGVRRAPARDHRRPAAGGPAARRAAGVELADARGIRGRCSAAGTSLVRRGRCGRIEAGAAAEDPVLGGRRVEPLDRADR